MSNVTKFLLLAFGLGLTCLLVLYYNRVAEAGFQTSDTALAQIEDFNRELSESSLTMYDGYEVTGSDVVNFIKKNLGSYEAEDTAPVYVKVETDKKNMTYRNGDFLPQIQDFSSEQYIKPIGKFMCSIVRDANDVIIGINFSQR